MKRLWLPLLVIVVIIFTMAVPAYGSGGIRYVDNVNAENEWFSTSDWVTFKDEGPANRVPSGVGGTASFQPGENVIGFQITLSNGQVLNKCYLAVAPMSGTVVDGVVNPWGPEVNLPSCYGATAPSAPAPAAAPSAPAPASETASGGIINLLDGSSLLPRTTLPDASGQSPYQDTGKIGAAQYNVTVQTGQVLIVGGVTVVIDGQTHDQGLIVAKRGPQTVSFTVADGFYVLKSELQAPGEFCTRIAQHRANAWLMTEIQPLEGWAVCW